MLDIATHEKTLYTAFQNFTVLNFGRVVRYGFERKGQPSGKYLDFLPLTWTQSGKVQKLYTDQEVGDDLIEQMVMPIELSFSLRFIGGSARGELSMCLVNLEANFEVMQSLYSDCMIFARSSGFRDGSLPVGGQAEQRAQADIFFNAGILPDTLIVPSIRTVDITGETRNNNDELVEQINPVISPDT